MESEKRNNDDFKPEIGRGCAFCDSGDEVEARPCDGCFKLHETAWQEGYPDNIPTDLFEVRFKNTRRSFYQNVNNLDLKRGDIVAVEASPGHDIGIVSLTGDMVARQIRRLGFTPYNGEYRKIYRKAKPYDIERWQEAIALEHETMIAARQIAADMGLNMKIGDVEYQGDKIKAIFYYIADERVDFRELIKVFAERFRIRIEMKQIGARQEAGRIGGLGACGRELCCASWMSTFTSVTTGAARVQEISLNPQKLAGQCSKLKCCMMYEYDAYVDARKEFPRLREPLQTIEGEWFLVKNDILSGTMTFSSSKEAMVNVTTLPVGRVKEILAMNRAGKKADQLVDEADMPPAVEEPNYGSESVEDSITRFDKARRRKRSGRSGRGGERRAEHRTGDAPKERAEEAPRRDGDSPKEEGRTRREGGDRQPGRRGGRNRQGGANRGEGAPGREQQPREGRPAREGQPRENREPREPREGKAPREGAEQRQPREPRENKEPRENREPRESGGRGRSEGRNRRRGGAPKGERSGEERPARETPGDNETR